MTKTFTVERITKTLIKKLRENLATVNASKIGRNRRGSLLLYSFDVSAKHDGILVVTLEWSRRSGMSAQFLSRDLQRCRVQLYRFCDHKLLLKKLGSA